MFKASQNGMKSLLELQCYACFMALAIKELFLFSNCNNNKNQNKEICYFAFGFLSLADAVKEKSFNIFPTPVLSRDIS